MERTCKICKKPISGRADKVTCGVGCRKQWYKINQYRKHNNTICNLFDGYGK